MSKDSFLSVLASSIEDYNYQQYKIKENKKKLKVLAAVPEPIVMFVLCIVIIGLCVTLVGLLSAIGKFLFERWKTYNSGSQVPDHGLKALRSAADS
jgi:hypothetical protein